MTADCAAKEKNHAALSSLLWALFLTIIKLAAGLFTNSLGLLSEALHSGLDLVAAGITFFAVRMSSRPADKRYPYGYGKVENLSALAETMLLLLTCGWIVWEAVDRLFYNAPEIVPSWWGVGVIGVSLVVDINRSAMLRRVAKKHRSQALEADALHFTTDIWSSGVVLVGLLCLQLGAFLPSDSILRPFLHRSDAIAALFVSGIVVVVGIRLSRRAVSSLLDGGGREHAEQLERALAERLPEYRVRRLRIRESGADIFMDITVEAPAELRLDAAHDVTQMVETVALEVVPGADMTVHVEPRTEPPLDSPEGMMRRINAMADAHSISVHNVVLSMHDEKLTVFLHVETPPNLTLGEAHSRVDLYEKELGKQINASIDTHIEPGERIGTGNAGCTLPDKEVISSVLRERVLPHFPEVSGIHELSLLSLGGVPFVRFHCTLPSSMTVARAHDVATALEHSLREKVPGLERILIHTDPA